MNKDMKHFNQLIAALFIFIVSLSGCIEEDSEEMMETEMQDSNNVNDQNDQQGTDTGSEDMTDDDSTNNNDDNNSDEDDNTDNPSSLGAAPEFSLTSVNGGTVSLSDFSGDPLIIFFFGNSCPNCISAGPDIESQLNQKYAGSNVALIGIDTWGGSNTNSVGSFQKSAKVTFDLLLNGSSTASNFESRYDRLVVVDGKGDIVFKGSRNAINDINNVISTINKL
ncbi:peroxiredoxin family protein [Reichenbachiella versicolor]|uniref:peroxiredoxin family protein n=1 Tax=Reichenbachiella versicolor TaxID=1821036 RepID=UPI0013A53B1C|nr:TlpA disulfide reductase family protein [Reichenbachiella versicolor]